MSTTGTIGHIINGAPHSEVVIQVEDASGLEAGQEVTLTVVGSEETSDNDENPAAEETAEETTDTPQDEQTSEETADENEEGEAEEEGKDEGSEEVADDAAGDEGAAEEGAPDEVGPDQTPNGPGAESSEEKSSEA